MAFFSRGFVLLWQGQLVSQLGNQAFLIATAYYTLEVTGSTTMVSVVMVASTLPLVLLGPIGGAVADRHSRRRILIATDVLRAIAVGALGLVLLRGREPPVVWLFVPLAAFCGTMAALFTPALQAIIPDLVDHDRLGAANSFSQLSTQTAVLVGQAAGGLLYVQWGPAVLLLLDAFSFGYAALATWFIPFTPWDPGATGSLWDRIEGYIGDTRGGLEYVTRRGGMLAVLVVFAGVNVLFLPVFVLLPLYAQAVLRGGPDWYGFLLAAAGAGALSGAAAAAMVLAKVRGRASLIGFAVGGIAWCVLLLALTTQRWIALGALFTIGGLSSLVNITVVTAFQLAVPGDMRGRVMALVVAVSTAAVPLGLGVGGVLGDLWRDSLPLFFGICGSAIAILAVAAIRLSGFRDILDARPADVPPPGHGGG